jgi:hypothetical protein
MNDPLTAVDLKDLHLGDLSGVFTTADPGCSVICTFTERFETTIYYVAIAYRGPLRFEPAILSLALFSVFEERVFRWGYRLHTSSITNSGYDINIFVAVM